MPSIKNFIKPLSGKSLNFADNNIEKKYLATQLSVDIKYNKFLLPILGIINFLFLIPDYINNNLSTFLLIFILRLTVLLYSLYLYYKSLYDIKDKNTLYRNNTRYEVVFISSFLIIAYIYNSFAFVIQSLWMVLLIIGVFFLIPNKLLKKIIISVFTSFIFYTISFFHHGNNLTYIYAISAFTFVLIFLSAYSVFHTDRSRRIIFLEQEKYKEISIRDPLTGIYNKRKFLEDLAYHIKEVKRYKSNLSLIIFDIDNFKEINDHYGHSTGDKVLINICKIIEDLIRDLDIFSRIGGEEFAIILPNTKLIDAKALANRLCISISNNLFHNIENITCSFGVGQFSKGDQMNFFDSVDEALYKAKKSGKNRVETIIYT
ncbi:GGDEF domain-containing protein [Natronospora cellulosivora (SeqCode)]